MMILSPLDVLRALPRLGVNLILPALVIGAVMGSMVDMLLGHEGYPLAKVGVLLGPVAFALAINLLHRWEGEALDWTRAAEEYRKEETAKRQAAAKARGELVNLDEHRATRR